MKPTKIFMVAGLALALSATAQARGGKGGGKGGGMMRGTDPAKMQKILKELREKADVDGDGELNGDERKAFFKGMREAVTKQREEHMTKWDKDGDGELSDEEKKAIEAGQTDDEFKRMDTNGDGVVDKKEFLASKEAQRKGMKSMRDMFRDARGDRGGDAGDDKAMIERFDENGDGKVDDDERLKAAQATLERMERKGLTGEWKKFDKDGNGTLSQEERDALVKEIFDRLTKKTEGGDKDKSAKTDKKKKGGRPPLAE